MRPRRITRRIAARSWLIATSRPTVGVRRPRKVGLESLCGTLLRRSTRQQPVSTGTVRYTPRASRRALVPTTTSPGAPPPASAITVSTVSPATTVAPQAVVASMLVTGPASTASRALAPDAVLQNASAASTAASTSRSRVPPTPNAANARVPKMPTRRPPSRSTAVAKSAAVSSNPGCSAGGANAAATMTSSSSPGPPAGDTSASPTVPTRNRLEPQSTQCWRWPSRAAPHTPQCDAGMGPPQCRQK